MTHSTTCVRWIVAALTLGGCTSFQLRGGPADPAMRRPTVIPASTRSGSPAASEARRICRGSMSSGWIAIDYVADEELCPASKSRNRTHGAAVVVRYGSVPVGGELTVCADERVPRDWVREQTTLDGSQCPPDEPSERPNIMVIRRLR